MSDPALWIRQLHPDDRARVLRMTALANKTGDPFDLEYRILTRSGEIRWLQNSAHYVKNEQDQKTWNQVTSSDIILAKGMANFENYSDEKNFHFLLISKCNLVSQTLYSSVDV